MPPPTYSNAAGLHPDLVDSHWLLSRLRRPDPGSRIDRIDRALTRVAPGDDEAFLAYALHNELHDSGDYRRAWHALERACRAKRKTLNYDPANDHPLFSGSLLHEWSAADLNAAVGTDDDSLAADFRGRHAPLRHHADRTHPWRTFQGFGSRRNL